MNNEIGRKLTSLTLMTIMLAAGFTAFAPIAMPEAAAANANLFVSAENSQFQNYFAGPMVIEAVVIDSDIKDTDKGKGEPDVTVNGNKLRMVQATDGNWYGYFADKTQALRADATATNTLDGSFANSLDFGTFCSRTTNWAGVTLTQTVGVAFPFSNTIPTSTSLRDGNINADISTSLDSFTCTGTPTGTFTNNTGVLREEKTVNPGTNSATGVLAGQIGLNKTASGNGVAQATSTTVLSSIWPFIQLYNFNPTGNVVVQYNKGGGVQSTTLTFDDVDKFAKAETDRATYPLGAQVHVTITDLQLNIDPTDEDSWTFGTNNTGANATVFYQLFDENGAKAADGKVRNTIVGNLTKLMFDDNGKLLVNANAQSAATNVLTIDDNGDSVIDTGAVGTANQIRARTSTIMTGGMPVVITETGPNTGIFGTYDESDDSVLEIRSNAPRGKSATIDYNESPKSVVVGHGFATVDIQSVDAEWNSGQEIPVKVTDSDANKNSRVDEDLDFENGDVSIIPALTIGDPFTLGEGGAEPNTINLQVLFANRTRFSGNDGTTGGNSTLANIDDYGSVASVGSLRGVSGQYQINVQRFSERAMITPNVTSGFLANATIIDLETTAGELRKSINDPRSSASPRFHGFNLLNVDIRGLNSTITAADVWLLVTADTTNGVLKKTNSGGLYTTTTQVKAYELANMTSGQGLFILNRTSTAVSAANTDADRVVANIFDGTTRSTDKIGYFINFTVAQSDLNAGDAIGRYGIPQALNVTRPIAIDLFSFGYLNDGLIKSDRINNQIIRIEAEETGDNTSIFEGSLEFTMLNQLNILDASTYSGLTTIAVDPRFIVHQDLDDEEAPRVNYNDLGADGVVTQVADQEDAPTHSGVVSFDKPTYKIADTVLITLEDQDLNTDVDLIDIYTVVNSTTDSGADDTVGKTGLHVLSNGDALGRLLDVTFDDARWKSSSASSTCDNTLAVGQRGLFDTGFTLIEQGPAAGIFTGDYQVPGTVCNDATGGLAAARNTQGLDMEVNYVDFRDASGQIVEVGDGAGIRANTGSVSLDRTVYPVPFGSTDDFATQTNTKPNVRSIFPLHLSAITATGATTITTDETLGDGPLTIHVQVNDPDFDTSASGEDIIAQNVSSSAKRGLVSVTLSRDTSKVLLAYAGGPAQFNGLIDVDGDNTSYSSIRELGPISETTPSSGIFEFDLPITYVDGPASTTCPATDTAKFDSLLSPGTKSTRDTRFDEAPATGSGNFCILQGDIITVEYTDPADASGNTNTVTDSATFDLRNGALQSDKSVYIIGSDMILTLIEPDLDLDSDLAETYDLDLIEWDSDAATVTMGGKSGTTATDQTAIAAAFDPEPSDLRETGDSTGIYQTVIEIPSALKGDNLERGEEIVLEFTDWGPSGADYVGQEDEDINLTIFTSNFGATVELDQKVYSWTDKVYITVVAPDQNFDSNLVDEIGQTSDPLKVSTRGKSLSDYKLVETGTDTGIFTGEVILVGFNHDSNGAAKTGGAPRHDLTGTGTGPTGGFLGADDDDGLTVSYEFSEDETVVGSALIRWNIGEVAWLEASYPASGTGVVRVIDPDMNLNPESVDNFDVDVWSDSDSGGIDLTVTETNEATGIFEGTVFFTTTDDSSGHRLRVAEGDTVTAEYKDRTLPDPYTTADELDITGTAFIGTVVPPLERAPASNARVVDAFGNTLDEVSVDQQVQITADLTNGQDREQPFAYLVQIQDENGVTVSLAWITGSLSAGQSFSPALSWIATAPGTYTATVFVWESVDNPTALSPPVSVDITVS